MAASALGLGGIKLPEDQKRLEVLNIDTDDDDTSIEEEHEDSIINEDELIEIDEEEDDFEEIIEKLSDFPTATLHPNSLYVGTLKWSFSSSEKQ